MRKTQSIIVKIEHKVSKEEIMGLLDSASRGSSYWAEQELAWESVCNKALTEQGVKIKDTEDDDKVHILNLEKVVFGLNAMAKKEPESWADFVGDNGDDYTGDTFLQICLFGEVLYG